MELKNNKILISAIVVVLVVLVSYNFESLTGKTITTNSRTIAIVPSTVMAGDTIEITVTPKTGTMNTGGSYAEQLWLKGPGVTKKVSNYICIEGYSGKCTKAEGSTWIPSTSITGTYSLTVEQTTPTGRDILATKNIIVS